MVQPKNKLLLSAVMFFALFFFYFASICDASNATRTIVDQLGREVTIPQKVDRVVVLMHHALDIMLELGAQDQIVGVLSDWNKYLPPGIVKVWPDIEKMPAPGDLRTMVNTEELLKLKPDVVIITHYMIEKTGKQIEAIGLPVVGISLYKAGYEEVSVLNPKLKDPDQAYTEGLKEGVLLLGDILGRREQAEKLNAYIFKNRQMVAERLGNMPRAERVRTYMAYPELYTMGTGKYASVIMERAGGLNVAMEISGYKQVTMEDVLRWNPQVIFTQDRYRNVADEIMKSEAWGAVDAVKDGKVYVTPEYVKPWGHPCPESIGLGELWMAVKLYPDKFKDIDLNAYVNDFYTTFYGVPYSGNH
jgi:iron complex transport system substrate-binding protein